MNKKVHRFAAFAILALVSFPALCRDSLITWDVTPTGILEDTPSMKLSGWKQLTPEIAIRVYTFEREPGSQYAEWVFKNTGSCQLQPFKFMQSYIEANTGKRVDFNEEVKMSLNPRQATAADWEDCGNEGHCWATAGRDAKNGTLAIKITSPLQCVPQAAPAPAGSTVIN